MTIKKDNAADYLGHVEGGRRVFPKLDLRGGAVQGTQHDTQGVGGGAFVVIPPGMKPEAREAALAELQAARASYPVYDAAAHEAVTAAPSFGDADDFAPSSQVFEDDDEL